MKREPVSQTAYKVKEEKNVLIPMRDGVRLAVDVYRPDVEGKFPALLSMSPYGKELQHLPMPPQPWGISGLWDGCIEAGDTDYIVRRGYAHVIADVRGTGDSEGEYFGLYSKQEAEDGYDLVESIAKQPWCDGNVGMIGISYYGVTQYLVAGEEPPHLKAICPFEAGTDLYRRVYDGGILNAFFYGLWSGHGGDSGYAPRNVISAMLKSLPKEELDRRIQEAKNNADLKNYSVLYSILLYPKKNPIFFDILLNPTDGPFWWERSPYTRFDRIKIPVYCGVGWGPPSSHLSGAFSAYLGVKEPKKLLLWQCGMPERPFHQYHDEIIRWYDYWLKGIDTGIMNEPPIKIFVMGANQWRYEREWPLARTKWTKFYLRLWGRLSTEPETLDDITPNSFVQEPPTVTAEIKSLKYVTSPLEEDTEVTGPIALYLYASLDTDDTNWIVTLKDVDVGGSEAELRTGFLKASHRTVDESKSQPWQPYHPHTKPEPVVPGQVYEYVIEILPISNVFKAGHRIKLEISSMDSPSPVVSPSCFFHVGSSKVTLHKIYCDRKRQSYLLLPIIPK